MDQAEVLQILEESEVVRQPRPPGLGAWMREVATRAFTWWGTLVSRLWSQLARRVTSSLTSLGLPAALWLRAVVWTFLAAAVGLLLFRLARWWGGRKGRRPRAEAPAGLTPLPVVAGRSDAAGWRERAEQCLGRGLLAEALEAVWWWLACSLAGDGVDPSWTGRELLVHTRRRDLAPAVRRLEAMTYGPARPAVREVRSFMDQLARVLP